MKILPRLFLVLTLIAAALIATSSVALGASKLIYSDEFNSTLDTTTWSNNTPWNTHYTTGELEYYDPANCRIAGGVMDLKSESRATGGYAYASGIVTSLARQKFSYGYFEIRAKLPKGPGIWPAFWLTNDSTLEIDGLEMLGDQPGRLYQTLHRNDRQIYQGVHDGPDYSAGYHTFAVDWQPGYVRWYVDGVMTADYEHAMPSDPMWICLNTAVGGSWPGAPTSATKFPVDYDIDYVRVYDSKPVIPVAAADTYATPADATLTAAAPGLLGNDSGPNPAGLSAVALTLPAHGRLALDADGSFTYVPDAGYNGTDQFAYFVTDGTTVSDAAPVSLFVGVPVPAKTVVPKPVVKRAGSARTSYRVSGTVHLATSLQGANGSLAGAASAPPVVLKVQVQRRVAGVWRAYRTWSKPNPASRYSTVLHLRQGTFRFRTIVATQQSAAQSGWTGRLAVR